MLAICGDKDDELYIEKRELTNEIEKMLDFGKSVIGLLAVITGVITFYLDYK